MPGPEFVTVIVNPTVPPSSMIAESGAFERVTQGRAP